jgi:hypothetical protein
MILNFNGQLMRYPVSDFDLLPLTENQLFAKSLMDSEDCVFKKCCKAYKKKGKHCKKCPKK